MSATKTKPVEPDRDVLARPVFLLARVGRIAARRLDDYLAVTGLKRPHAGVLMELRNVGPMSQQSLGERLHIDPSNLVRSSTRSKERGCWCAGVTPRTGGGTSSRSRRRARSASRSATSRWTNSRINCSQDSAPTNAAGFATCSRHLTEMSIEEPC